MKQGLEWVEKWTVEERSYQQTVSWHQNLTSVTKMQVYKKELRMLDLRNH